MRIRQLVKFLKTLFRVLKYGRRRHDGYDHLITPKWARASMRAENRFRRAMRNPNKPQIPFIKRWRVRNYVNAGGNLKALEYVIKGLQEASSFTRWANAFKEKALTQHSQGRVANMVERYKQRRLVKKNRGLIRNTIEY